MAGDYAQLQSIARQLVTILEAQTGVTLGKEVFVNDDETNDLHIDVRHVTIHPLYFTAAANPIAVVQHVFKVSKEFDDKRRQKTEQLINHLKWDLRVKFKQLLTLDLEAAIELIGEFDQVAAGEEELAIEETITLEEVANG